MVFLAEQVSGGMGGRPHVGLRATCARSIVPGPMRAPEGDRLRATRARAARPNLLLEHFGTEDRRGLATAPKGNPRMDCNPSGVVIGYQLKATDAKNYRWNPV